MMDWHFYRPELASRILGDLFDRGIARQAYFGRRRIGKTEFLTKDLLPAAKEKGVHALYCSFWELPEQPQLALIKALTQSLPQKPGLFQRFSFSAGLTGITAALTPSAVGKIPNIPTADLIEVSNAFGDWVSRLKGQAGLIILDEIQHLATNDAFNAFSSQLRTLLDQAGNNIRVIFTGSSQTDLRRLFQDPRAAFYSFSQVSDFPVFGEDFVNHVCQCFQKVTGLTLKAEAVSRVLEESAGNAQLTIGLVQNLALVKSTELQKVWEEYKDEQVQPNGDLWLLWEKQHKLDKLVYRQFLSGNALFGETALAAYKKAGYSRGSAQQAIARLETSGLLVKVNRGEYQSGLPLLESWLRGSGG